MELFDCRKELTKDKRRSCRKSAITKVKNEWIKRLSFGPKKKENYLTNIWLSIFAVNIRNIPNPYWIYNQINSIQEYQFKNYEDLIFSQIRNPGFLAYLNAFRNKKDNPNENLGRELLELYTLGVGNFSEEDVKNTALVLTGLMLDKNNNVKVSEKLRYRGETTILGKSKIFDLKSLIKLLVYHPKTAENISKRFCNYLLGEEVTTNEINQVIKNFKESNLDLKTLYSSLLNNEKYLKAKEFGTRLIDPITLVTKSIFLIGSNHQNNYIIGSKILSLMGQPLFEPPNPAGWPYGEGWISSSRNSNRRKGLRMLLRDEEIWDTRKTPNYLKKSLVPFKPLYLTLPCESNKENIAKLFADPSWNFSGPIDLNFKI